MHNPHLYNTRVALTRAAIYYILLGGAFAALLNRDSTYLGYLFVYPMIYLYYVGLIYLFLLSLASTAVLVRALLGLPAFAFSESELTLHTWKTATINRGQLASATYRHDIERGILVVKLKSGRKKRLDSAILRSPRDLELAVQKLGAKQSY